MKTKKVVLPKISCIVPVYNVENYLQRCVDSILAQTFSDFELILVDDGSPDNSGRICDEYAEKDKRIKVIHQKNKGVSAARNKGLDAARGEYVCFVDSDDWVEKDYMKTMYDAAVETGADLVLCGIKEQIKTGNYVDVNLVPVNQNRIYSTKKEILDLFMQLRELPKYTMQLHTPTCKLFASILIDRFRFDETMIISEDYCFNLNVFQFLSSCVCVSDNLYFYVYNSDSALHKKTSTEKIRKKIADLKKSIEDTDLFCKKNDLDENRILLFYGSVLYSISIKAMSLPKSERKANNDYIRKYLNHRFIIEHFNCPKKFITFIFIKLKMEGILKILYKTLKGEKI